MSDADFEAVRKLQAERNAATAGKKGSRTFDSSSQRTDNSTKASLTETFDTTLYDREGPDKYAGYNTSIAVDGDEEMEDEDGGHRLVGQYTATKDQIDELAHGNGVEEEDILTGREKAARIADRETDYQKRRFNRGPLTPTRADPFAANTHANVETDGQTYREIMALRELEKEEERVQKLIAEKQARGENGVTEHEATLKSEDKENADAGSTVSVATGRKRKQRWDVSNEPTEAVPEAPQPSETKTKRSRWDQTPAPAVPGTTGEAPKRRSRWDQAPAITAATPVGNQGLATPMHPSQVGVPMIPTSFGTDISGRNAPLSDEELDMMLPSEGYKILEPPPGYAPIRTPARKQIGRAHV